MYSFECTKCKQEKIIKDLSPETYAYQSMKKGLFCWDCASPYSVPVSMIMKPVGIKTITVGS